jgi:predicted lysophospholipase L1 biosynthesis ABC-type transport system permease subunit
MTDTFTIVGVVGDVKERRLNDPAEPIIYISYLQNPSRYLHLLVRTATPGPHVATMIQREIRRVDSAVGAYDIRMMEDVLEQAVAEPRLNSLLLWVFATVALVLSAIGVYGVTSYAVAQRTREFAIRMAVGARARNVFAVVTREGLAIAVTGISIGLAGALLLRQTLSSLLYGVAPTDGATLIASAGAVLVMVATAIWRPAWRATRVDLMTVLRND